MQVTINVSREIDKGVTQVFSCTANSVEEAIKTAQRLTTMAVANLPAASTDAATIEKHTGLQTDGIEGTSVKTETKADPKGKAETKKADVKVVSAQQPVEQKSAPSDGAGSTKTTTEKPADAPDTAERTYEEVRQKILTISKDMGREPTVAALARFGVTAGKDLKPEQYGPAYDYFVKVIAKEVDPTKSETAEDEFA